MQAQKIEYLQLDLNKNDVMKDALCQAQSEDYFVIGIEVTDIKLSAFCHLNIDPQHNSSNPTNITSVEMVYKLSSKIRKMSSLFKKILFVTIKPDLDSIAAMVLGSMYLKNKKFEITDNDLILRLITISNSDRHGESTKWDKRVVNNHFSDNKLFTKFGLPIGLMAFIGDVGISINRKVEVMFSYLENGTFEDIDKYTEKVLKKNKICHLHTNVDVIIPSKLVFIESSYRGAIGLGYNYAPVVIAKNPRHKFSNEVYGVKYTIAQYSSGYVNLHAVLTKLSQLEKGWGGDANSIIGSPQKGPSIISKKELINIVEQLV